MYKMNQSQILAITNYIFMEDPIMPADIIFIPGCARPEHTEEAAQLYREGYAPLLLPSGGYSKLEGGFRGVKVGESRYGGDYSCEADFLKEVLLTNGVPEEAILPEKEATYTLENAEKSRILLEQKRLFGKIGRAILCCKAHHARRAFFYYQMVFPEIEIIVHSVPVDGISREKWFTFPEGRRMVLSELARMGQQILMMEGKIDYSS